MKRKIDKKRINLYLTEDVKKELDRLTYKYGMTYGNYLTYLILQEKENEAREKQYRELQNNAKIWTANTPL